MTYLYIVTSLWLNSMSSVLAQPSPKMTPIGKQLNQIIRSEYESLAENINQLVEKGAREQYLSRFSKEDKLLYQQMIARLKEVNLRASGSKHSIFLTFNGGTTTLELIDLLSNQYKVNGKVFQFKPSESFEKNLENAVALFHSKKDQKTSWLERILPGDDAHAFAFLAVPVWALIAGGSVAVATDTIVSSSANDIQNSLNPRVRERIQELEAKFKKRADQCESDLGRLYSGDRAIIQGNSSVKMVATLIDGLGAELEDTWFDGDGKKQIDYDDLGCEAYDGKEGIKSGQVFGIVPGTWNGKIVAPLCSAQKRLNDCFSDIEEIMRDKDIAISDIQKGRSSEAAYDGLLQEYQELSGTINQ